MILSAIKSTSLQFLRRSTKSGHETSVKFEPAVPLSRLARSCPTKTSNRSCWATAGNGRSSSPSIQLKTAALAPIPKVRQMIANAEKPGLRRSTRIQSQYPEESSQRSSRYAFRGIPPLSALVRLAGVMRRVQLLSGPSLGQYIRRSDFEDGTGSRH